MSRGMLCWGLGANLQGRGLQKVTRRVEKVVLKKPAPLGTSSFSK